MTLPRLKRGLASTYRRLQRFFQQVLLPDDWCVGIVLGLIGNPGRWYLCMDRTNWKIGKSDVNIGTFFLGQPTD